MIKSSTLFDEEENNRGRPQKKIQQISVYIGANSF